MSDTFSIVCAWKDLGDYDRLRGFNFTRRYWKTVFPEAEIVVATPEPFTRARGLNEAVRQASYDLILQADPDTIVPRAQAEEALRQAAESDGLVVPFTRYLYLRKWATDLLHAAGPDGLPTFPDTACEFVGEGGCGPVTAFSRSTWERAGGYDERFGLWGGDDSAFGYACEAFTQPTRTVDGPCLHSWHPRLPQSIPGGPGYAEQFAILAEYRDAARISNDAVRALVEARA